MTTKAKNTKSILKEQRIKAQIETTDNEVMADATKLYNSIRTRVTRLKEQELTTIDIQNEVAGELYIFLSEGYLKILGYTSIQEFAEKVGLGKDATVRFYAKHGAANEVCAKLSLPFIKAIEAGKKLTSGLLHPNAKGEMVKPNYTNMVDCEMLEQRIKLYHTLVKKEGSIRAATMACNMVTSGIESLEDAEKIAKDMDITVEEAVNPNVKTPDEQGRTSRDNMFRYVPKMEKDPRIAFLLETRDLTNAALKEAKKA